MRQDTSHHGGHRMSLRYPSWEVQPTTVSQPTSNIDIYPSTLVFVENIAHKYDFHGVELGGLRLGLGVGGPDPKKTRKPKGLWYSCQRCSTLSG